MKKNTSYKIIYLVSYNCLPKNYKEHEFTCFRLWAKSILESKYPNHEVFVEHTHIKNVYLTNDINNSSDIENDCEGLLSLYNNYYNLKR